MRIRTRVAPPEPGAPLWMITFSDLMTQILVFFVMLYSFSTVNPDKFQQVLGSVQGALGAADPAAKPGPAALPAQNLQTQGRETPLGTVRQELVSAMSRLNLEKGVNVEQGDRSIIIRVDAALLFESGRAEVKQQAIPALDAIGGVLGALSNPVRIEGHTDNVPMLPNPQYPDNWMLSAGRATSVLRYLSDFGGIPYRQLSVAGFADTRPVAPNDTPEGRSRNRRVDIVVLGR